MWTTESKTFKPSQLAFHPAFKWLLIKNTNNCSDYTNYFHSSITQPFALLELMFLWFAGDVIEAYWHWDRLCCILFLHLHTMAVKHTTACCWIITNLTQFRISTECLLVSCRYELAYLKHIFDISNKADYRVNNIRHCWDLGCAT